jgi:hypothetical protein
MGDGIKEHCGKREGQGAALEIGQILKKFNIGSSVP